MLSIDILYVTSSIHILVDDKRHGKVRTVARKFSIGGLEMIKLTKTPHIQFNKAWPDQSTKHDQINDGF